MRVELGIAELGGDALFESLGDEVLEALGLLVHLFHGVVEDLVEEGLDEAMMADDLERAPLAGRRELHAAVASRSRRGAVPRGELLEHVGDRGRRE